MTGEWGVGSGDCWGQQTTGQKTKISTKIRRGAAAVLGRLICKNVFISVISTYYTFIQMNYPNKSYTGLLSRIEIIVF